MNNVILWLQGKKTYIVASLLVFYAILDVITGQMTLIDFFSSDNVKIVLEGLGLATLKAGISRKK